MTRPRRRRRRLKREVKLRLGAIFTAQHVKRAISHSKSRRHTKACCVEGCGALGAGDESDVDDESDADESAAIDADEDWGGG